MLPARLLCQWNFFKQEYWIGLPSLLQWIFLTQGFNLGLLHCRWILCHLSHQGSPVCVYVYLYTYMYVYVYIYMFIYVCMCVYIYTNIYLYIKCSLYSTGLTFSLPVHCSIKVLLSVLPWHNMKIHLASLQYFLLPAS